MKGTMDSSGVTVKHPGLRHACDETIRACVETGRIIIPEVL